MQDREDRVKGRKHHRVGSYKVKKRSCKVKKTRNHNRYDADNMKKKKEDGNSGLDEKLNQDNTVLMLGMNHLNPCSRWPDSTHPPGRGCHRAPAPLHNLMQEQEGDHKCKIGRTGCTHVHPMYVFRNSRKKRIIRPRIYTTAWVLGAPLSHSRNGGGGRT